MRLLIPLLLFVQTVFACPSLSSQQAAEAISQLVTEIAYHDDLYFNHNKPVISDSEFDALQQQLNLLRQCFPQIAIHNKVIAHQKATVPHVQPMGSLHKVSDEAALRHFVENEPNSVILQPKIDGVAAELVYQEGKLVQASTRGDGHKGRDILPHIVAAAQIPTQLPAPFNQHTIVLHGELYAQLDRMDSEALQHYASARHYVAGQLHRKAPDISALATIAFFPWTWLDAPFDSETDSLSALKEMGFTAVAQHSHTIKSPTDLAPWITHYQQDEAPPFLMDGVVVKVDNYARRQVLGASSEAPHWARALKFDGVVVSSTVEKIIYTVGKSGRVTPVAQIKPVLINNQHVQRISLGSEKSRKAQGIEVGQTVQIELRGGANPVLKHNDAPAAKS